jgi:uncharacterized protein DUF6228
VGEFAIRSNRGSDQLVLWTVKPRDEWRARLDFGDLVAEAKVYERYSRDALHLDAYFAELTRQWRGWAGVREWESLGLRLGARHDGLGHVTLEATLDQDYTMADRWRVRAALVMDAGSLDALAREARVLDAV